MAPVIQPVFRHLAANEKQISHNELEQILKYARCVVFASLRFGNPGRVYAKQTSRFIPLSMGKTYRFRWFVANSSGFVFPIIINFYSTYTNPVI